MIFDFAWSELAVIAAVALVVIGPKDLPRVLRSVGMWVRRARAIAHEFQGSLEQMVREAELEEVRKEVNKVAQLDIDAEFAKSVDPHGEVRSALSDPDLAHPLAIEAEQRATPAAEPPVAAPETLPPPGEGEAHPGTPAAPIAEPEKAAEREKAESRPAS